MGLGAVRLRAHRVHRHLPASQDLRFPETNLANLSGLVLERDGPLEVQVFVAEVNVFVKQFSFNLYDLFEASYRIRQNKFRKLQQLKILYMCWGMSDFISFEYQSFDFTQRDVNCGKLLQEAFILPTEP